MQITKSLNLVKLFIIVFVIIGGIWYINKNKNENFGITTIPNTTMANILPPISNAIGSGYNALNVNRFNAIDNQMRLNKLNTRINKLLENIQKTYNMNNMNNKLNANPVKFY